LLETHDGRSSPRVRRRRKRHKRLAWPRQPGYDQPICRD
jgi:hypothetical protein